MTNKNFNRRDFLKTSGRAGIAAGLSSIAITSLARNNGHGYPTIKSGPTPFKQQPLSYAYNALEPNIDAATMEIHYSKHAAGYAKNLADALIAENVDTNKTSLEDILNNISKYSVKMRNNAGGHYNHELFWKLMSPPSADRLPSRKLLAAIQKDFGSEEAFKTQFSDAAKNRFGSGWAWLVFTHDQKLVIGSTPNQDNPLMDSCELKGFPLLGIDVLEHAYYLKYQNKRADYISAWWNLVNWNFIGQRFEQV
ncbi:MAG TPA: Fe-Mn family superoxide dismutase [Puia sp.]|nr:Fe-Mn family superoxide dismutase [Puia sp.]